MTRKQNIFETNNYDGGLLVDRNTNLPVGFTSRGVDQHFFTASTDPVTGIVTKSSGGIDFPPEMAATDFLIDHVVSGLTLPASGTIGVASIAAGVIYIVGKRATFAGAVLDLGATKDNYIDFGLTGLTITQVAVGAGAPAVAVNSMRLGYLTTNATAVTARVIDAKDSNGNWMGNYIATPYSRCVLTTSTYYPTGDRALPFGTGATKYDNDSLHSESVNNTRFTVTRNGAYLVSGFVTITAAAAGNFWGPKIFKNGASAVIGSGNGDAATVLIQRTGGVINAKVGDYFELYLANATVAVTASAFGIEITKVV